MRNLRILFITLLALTFFSSCEKKITSHDNSSITYYVNLELVGDNVVVVALGNSYTEPGVLATENGVDVSSDLVISSDVDESALGVYDIIYTATNADGFSSSISRKVVIYDPAAPETDISGAYSTSIVRTESDGSNPRPYSGAMNITKVAKGIFYVDCLLGGTYSVGYGYGASYAMTGYIALNADNTISLLSSFVKGWGDGLEGFQNGVYDPATGLPYWESIYAGADIFSVTSSK